MDRTRFLSQKRIHLALYNFLGKLNFKASQIYPRYIFRYCPGYSSIHSDTQDLICSFARLQNMRFYQLKWSTFALLEVINVSSTILQDLMPNIHSTTYVETYARTKLYYLFQICFYNLGTLPVCNHLDGVTEWYQYYAFVSRIWPYLSKL